MAVVKQKAKGYLPLRMCTRICIANSINYIFISVCYRLGQKSRFKFTAFQGLPVTELAITPASSLV